MVVEQNRRKITDMVAKEDNIIIRKMKASVQDFRLFLKWMTDPHTMKYWERMTEKFTYERVVENYRENIEEEVEQCIIEYNHNAIGFCQFCILNAEYYEVPEIQYDKFVDKSDVVYGIDIFLGEVDYRNSGIGTKCLKILMKALFEKYHADILMIDPKIHNARAIRCYHKCGFKELFVVPQRELQDGIYHDSLIMGVRKTDLL